MRRIGFFPLVVAAALIALGLWFRATGPKETAGSALANVGRVTAPRDRSAAFEVRQPRSPTTPVLPPQPAAEALFEWVQPQNVAALNTAAPAPAHAIRYVRINRALIEGKSSPFWQSNGRGRMELPLPEGGSVAVVIDSSEMLGANRFSSVGHVEGVTESRVVFAYNDGFLSGSIDTPQHTYALRPATSDATQFYEIDPALLPPCGGVRHPVIDAKVLAAATARRVRQAALAESTTSGSRVAADSAPGNVEVHLMMLYTQSVKTTLSGASRVAALQSEFDAAVAKVNTELAASLVTARVKLVKIAETAYDESVSASNMVQEDALTALYKTSDGKMDEIHALRDQSGADVVCLAVSRSDSASIGLSFVLDTPTSVDQSAGLANPLFAFAVVQYATIAGTDVVPHELGHVLGCAHARGDPGATGTKDGAFTYSYGYRFFGSNGRQYHDIMAYSPGTGLGYYSNPKVIVPSPISSPIGIDPGQSGESDCALTIERDAFEVSTYRLQTSAAPAGTLVNVSTRAYVGTGDQVLIGGFVIGGAQPKRVLIRAAGPALTPYGVTNALTNPALDIYSGSNVIASNDNWGTQTNGASAADVAAAGGQVGAFTFAAGSADAALLTTLSPGAYSAIVKGVANTSGSALVEVYDVDRTNNKIVNLSTRGYADVGKEMFGGFVVQGETGTTKRVLIRVLGPTLARDFSVNGAMNDPTLELHNAAGDLLVKNDDWSSGTVAGTFDATSDFNPLVKTYSEQHINTTGFAPKNRREPCVLVDLAPGNYSVIVQPFQDLTRTPPEAAQPGVAIVEVYEITN
jgi:hypothetical protein